MFIRWFFKHIVVILIICAALLGYLKFDDLAHWFPSSVGREEQSAKVGTAGEHVVVVASDVAEDADVLSSGSVSLNTSQGELTEGVSGAQLKPTVQLASKQTASATDKTVGKTMSAPELSLMRGSGQKGSESVRMNEFGDVSRREAETSRRQQLPPTDTAADSKSLPTPLVEWIPPSAEPKEDTEEAAGTPAAQRQTVQEIWVDARTAFWNRDLAVAELKYHTLSAKLPDNPDVMGELGNVFYVQGKHKQTIAAYYRAAELLIEKGRSNRVNIILDLIYKLEPEKANILRARMARMYDDTGG